jgi:hypothetical protein
MNSEATNAVMQALREINQAWTTGQADAMKQRIHPQITLVPPGFTDRERGGEAFVKGHQEFCQRATIHEFHEDDPQVDVVDDIAVATYRYTLVYESAEGRFRSTGRDLWVFNRQDGHWLAAWRTVLDADETPA